MEVERRGLGRGEWEEQRGKELKGQRAVLEGREQKVWRGTEEGGRV